MIHPTSASPAPGLTQGGLGTGEANQQAGKGSGVGGGDDPTKTFLDYMKKSVAERMRDAWLAAHNLSEEKLKQMGRRNARPSRRRWRKRSRPR